MENVPEKTISIEHREKYLLRLAKVLDRIHFSSDIVNVLRELRKDILTLFGAEELFVFSVTENEKELILNRDNNILLRIPVDVNNIHGYVATQKIPLIIKNVYNSKELALLNPKVQFLREHDVALGIKTTQILIVPLVWGKAFLGLLQITNKIHGYFSEEDKHTAIKLAGAYAIALHNLEQIRDDVYGKYALLVQENILTKKQINDAILKAKEQKKYFEEILVKEYNVDKNAIRRSLVRYFNVPIFEFKPGLPIPHSLLSFFQPNYLRKNLWVPFQEENGRVYIAVDNPKTLYKLDDIKKTAMKEYSLFVALPEDIIKTIDYFWGPDKTTTSSGTQVFKDIVQKIEKAEITAGNIQKETKEPKENKDIQVIEEDHVVVKLVNQMVKDAYAQGASDIYIEPSPKKDNPVRIRFRIDGICYDYNKVPTNLKRSLISRIKIMSELDIAQRMTPQDGKIPFINYSDLDIELRVAIIPIATGDECAVIRLLAAKDPIALDKIGMRPGVYDGFRTLIQKPYGILLVVGPTGSGKTTTLHSALGYLNTPRKKIWTAEDPVEITQEGLSQVQIHNKSGFTFAKAMRAFLRAAPDVIMIGEMRDHETSSIAIEASLTGHLVMSTLHTNSAPETITRLIDMDIDPFNFGDALLGVLAQRLVRTLCTSCKQPVNLDQDLLNAFVHEYKLESSVDVSSDFQNNSGYKVYSAKGCSKCSNGLKGRMGIHELLVNSREITKLIHHKATVEEIRTQAIKEGMRTIKQDGIHKVLQGLVDIHQVRSVCLK